MQYQVKIEGEPLDIWTQGGNVDAITLRSDTEVWTQGGGGYVGPHGGYVAPPQVQSRTTQYKEVRFTKPDGSRQTTNAAGHVTVVPGDAIAFVYASVPALTKGPLVGIINHTERRWWSFDRPEILRDPGRSRRAVLMIAVAVLLTALTFRHVSKLSEVEPGDATISQRLADWDAYGTYQYRNPRKLLAVKDYAAQFKPTMDYSVGPSKLQERSKKLAANEEASVTVCRSFLLLGVLYIIGFFIVQKSFAVIFAERVNGVMQSELAKLCRAGPDATVAEIQGVDAPLQPAMPAAQVAAV